MLLRDEVGLLRGSADAIGTRQVHFVPVFRFKPSERLQHLNLLLHEESSDYVRCIEKTYTDS